MWCTLLALCNTTIVWASTSPHSSGRSTEKWSSISVCDKPDSSYNICNVEDVDGVVQIPLQWEIHIEHHWRSEQPVASSSGHGVVRRNPNIVLWASKVTWAGRAEGQTSLKIWIGCTRKGDWVPKGRAICRLSLNGVARSVPIKASRLFSAYRSPPLKPCRGSIIVVTAIEDVRAPSVIAFSFQMSPVSPISAVRAVSSLKWCRWGQPTPNYKISWIRNQSSQPTS